MPAHFGAAQRTDRETVIGYRHGSVWQAGETMKALFIVVVCLIFPPVGVGLLLYFLITLKE